MSVVAGEGECVVWHVPYFHATLNLWLYIQCTGTWREGLAKYNVSGSLNVQGRKRRESRQARGMWRMFACRGWREYTASATMERRWKRVKSSGSRVRAGHTWWGYIIMTMVVGGLGRPPLYTRVQTRHLYSAFHRSALPRALLFPVLPTPSLSSVSFLMSKHIKSSPTSWSFISHYFQAATLFLHRFSSLKNPLTPAPPCLA